MKLIEGFFEPNEEEKKLLDYVYSNSFALFYYQALATTHCYSHTLMGGSDKENCEGIINSEFYEPFKKLFIKICKQNNIHVDLIYRMSINSNFAHPNKHSEIHEDHNFDHTLFILYLTENVNGETYLFDDKENLIEKIEPKVNKYVFFKGKHASGFPLPGERKLILITTFKQKEIK